jgi:hypothetical protein
MPRSEEDEEDKVRESLARHIETWRLAEPELRAMRIREAKEINVKGDIRQLFTGSGLSMSPIS